MTRLLAASPRLRRAQQQPAERHRRGTGHLRRRGCARAIPSHMATSVSSLGAGDGRLIAVTSQPRGGGVGALFFILVRCPRGCMCVRVCLCVFCGLHDCTACISLTARARVTLSNISSSYLLAETLVHTKRVSPLAHRCQCCRCCTHWASCHDLFVSGGT